MVVGLQKQTQVSLRISKKLDHSGIRSYGDMVLILNDESKVEMKSLPLFREKKIY